MFRFAAQEKPTKTIGVVDFPLSSAHGTYKTVKARFWSWFSSQRPENLFRCSLFARKLRVVRVGGDERELWPWQYMYEGGRGRWRTPTMALHVRIQHGE